VTSDEVQRLQIIATVARFRMARRQPESLSSEVSNLGKEYDDDRI
jgi:hypothetical protein